MMLRQRRWTLHRRRRHQNIRQQQIHFHQIFQSHYLHRHCTVTECYRQKQSSRETRSCRRKWL
jgi:hypothetical protein